MNRKEVKAVGTLAQLPREGVAMVKADKPFFPWDEALKRFGEERLRQAAGGGSRLSNWKSRGVPGDVIAQLLWEHHPASIEGPWSDPAWRLGRVYTKCQEQMVQLSDKARWGDIFIISAILDRLVPWTEEDWKRLYLSGRDLLLPKKAGS